jgi:hypothetical protein
MANNYYTFSPTFVPGAIVRADEVNTQLSGIEGAFDNLPTAVDALTTGKATFATESGSGNAYAVTMPDTRTVNTDGDEIIFYATHSNTGAATLNVDSIGAVTLTDRTGAALVADDIVDGRLYMATYDATNTRFVLDVTTNVVTNIIDEVQGSGTDDPTSGTTFLANLLFVNSLDDLLANVGYVSGTAFRITNRVHGGIVALDGENSAGVVKALFQGDPDGGSKLFYDNQEECSTTDGGFTATNFFQNRIETQTNLLDSTHAVNTSAGKIAGAQVYDSTNGTPLWADGPGDTDTWSDAAGAVVHTPVP